jgi:hypothetical protein
MTWIGLESNGGSAEMSRTHSGGRRALAAAGVSIAALLCVVLAGCTGSGAMPKTDSEKVVFETLKLLTAPGEAICVDAATAGRPLDVFHTMVSNPPPGLQLPVWYVPARLKPTTALSIAQLYDSTQKQASVHIDQPANNTAQLLPALQTQLDRNAWIMSSLGRTKKVMISPDWPVGGLKARWWLRNRISSHCQPNFRIANPIVVRNVAFVTVTADHWGTTYALARQGAGWAIRAQWSNWLY